MVKFGYLLIVQCLTLKRLITVQIILANIPCVEGLRFSSQEKCFSMLINQHRARGWKGELACAISFFVLDNQNIAASCWHYCTRLLAACPQTPDFAFQHDAEGGWLCRSYDNNAPAKLMEEKLEQHTALTRYFQHLMASHRGYLP